MKLGLLTVLISNKKGDVFEVSLTKEQRLAVASVISQLSDGAIRVHKEKLPIKLDKYK